MANKYDLIVVLNPSMGEEALNALKDTVKAKISTEATDVEVTDIGLKKLAYEISDQKDGFYQKITYSVENTDFPKEIERVLNITDGILRFLNVRISE